MVSFTTTLSLLVAALVLTAAPVSARKGKTLDACTEDADCRSDLTCAIVDPAGLSIRSCDGSSPCTCFPSSLEGVDVCSPDVPRCRRDERCATVSQEGLSLTFCMSCRQSVVDVTFVDDGPRCIVKATPAADPDPAASPDVVEPTVTPAPVGPTPDAPTPVSPTTPDETVEPAFTDAPTTTDGATTFPTNPSPPPEGPDGPTTFPSEGDEEGDESPEPSEEDEVCVDARLLDHLPADRLVYSEHRRAAVLCDTSGSCATPGHMVFFSGRAMRMATYCATVDGGCKRSVMLVNSPRYARKLRVASRSQGLEFTAFSARFESRAEERFLATLVHAGL